MSYEVAFVSEIDQMLKEKITPEEIFKCVLNINKFSDSFTDEQNFYLKKCAVVLLKIRSKLYELDNSIGRNE